MTVDNHHQHCLIIADYLKTSLQDAKRLYLLQSNDVLLAIGYGKVENQAISIANPDISSKEARAQYNQKMAVKFKCEHEINGSVVTARAMPMLIQEQAGFASFSVGPSTIQYKREGNDVAISLLITDVNFLGQGYAKNVLKEFLAQCDQCRCNVYLTPVKTDPTINLLQLNAFYASFGFANNPERTKEFWTTSEINKHYLKRRLANPKSTLKHKPK